MPLRICIGVWLLFGIFGTGLGQDVRFPAAVLQSPKLHNAFYDQVFEATETGVYLPDTTNAILLENGYASSIIQNSKDWNPSSIARIDTIEVIFTLYPKDPSFWITNYHVLLSRRLQELFRVDPQFNQPHIHWKMVLQTDCSNEFEAIGLFHGFRVVYTRQEVAEYQPVPPEWQKATAFSYLDSLWLDSSRFSPTLVAVDTFIRAKGGYQDSTVLRILERNRQWQDALVILDWTGSMYHHGAMAVLWHLLNLEHTNIDYFVFFNDGNGKKRKQKEVGKTGGILGVPGNEPEELLKAFYKVERRGNGGDSPENDLEAIVRGVKKYPEFKEVILVGDNLACMRDFTLIDRVSAPVRILLPGKFDVINHQYINLAYRTGGSIHTFDDDIYDFSDQPSDRITINGITYVRNAFDLYQAEDTIGFKYCNAFYGIKRYSARTKQLP